MKLNNIEWKFSVLYTTTADSDSSQEQVSRLGSLWSVICDGVFRVLPDGADDEPPMMPLCWEHQNLRTWGEKTSAGVNSPVCLRTWNTDRTHEELSHDPSREGSVHLTGPGYRSGRKDADRWFNNLMSLSYISGTFYRSLLNSSDHQQHR